MCRPGEAGTHHAAAGAFETWAPAFAGATKFFGAALFQLVGDLVEAGLGADLVLVAAGRAGDADPADHLIADLDRQSALRRDDPVEVYEERRRVGLETLHDLAGRDPEGARGIGLALAVLDRVRRR